MPGFLINLPEKTTCKSGPAVVYHITCTSNRPECMYAQYVGSASSSDPTVVPMRARWANHKSRHKRFVNKCKFTDHLIKFHKGENPQQFCKITILQTANTIKEIKKLEIMWTRKLFSYKPTGLNVREEYDDDN